MVFFSFVSWWKFFLQGQSPSRVVKLRFYFLARAPACGRATVLLHEGAWLSEEKSGSWSPTCVCCSGAESARRKRDLSPSHRSASYWPSPAHWTVFLTPSNLGRASIQASGDPLLTSVSVAPPSLHGLQSWFAEESESTMHANEQGISTQPFLGRVCILRECPEEGALHKQKKTWWQIVRLHLEVMWRYFFVFWGSDLPCLHSPYTTGWVIEDQICLLNLKGCVLGTNV